MYSGLSQGVEGVGVLEGWDIAASGQTQRSARAKAAIPAPKWFEGWISVVLESKSFDTVAHTLLILAPFVASAGYVPVVVYGCASVSMPVDMMLGAGIFVFTSVWFFHFTGLVDAVRGAHRVVELVNHEKQYLVKMKTQRIERKASRSRAAPFPTRSVNAASVQNRLWRKPPSPHAAPSSQLTPPPPPPPPPVKDNLQLDWADINLHEETTSETLRDELLIRELGLLYTERHGVDELSWMRTSDYIPGRAELSDLKERTFSAKETAFIRTHPSFNYCDKSQVTLDQLREWSLPPAGRAEVQSDATSTEPPEHATAEAQSESSEGRLVSGLPAAVPGLLWQFKADDDSGWKDFDEAGQTQLSQSAADGMQMAQVRIAGEKFDADLSDPAAMTLVQKVLTDSKESVRCMPMRAQRPRFSNTSIELIDKAFNSMSYEGRTLYVTNVTESMDDEQLRILFAKVGNVSSARVYELHRNNDVLHDDDGKELETLDEESSQAGDSEPAPTVHYGVITMETPACIAKAFKTLRKYETLAAEKSHLEELQAEEKMLAENDTREKRRPKRPSSIAQKKRLQELNKVSQDLDALTKKYFSRYHALSLFDLKWQLLTYEMIPTTKNFSLTHLMVPTMAKFSVHHLHDVAQQQYEKELRMKANKEPGAIAFVTNPIVLEGNQTDTFPVVSLGGIALLSYTSTSRLRADGIGVARVELDADANAWLRVQFYIAVLLAAILFMLVVLTLVALVSSIVDNNGPSNGDRLSKTVDSGIGHKTVVAQYFLAPAGCVSDTMQTVHAVSLVIFWVPAALLFSVVYPAWQLSLMLGVTLAQDAVEDLMKDLGPLAAQQYLGEDTGRAMWTTRVQQPCTMIISTLKVLSAWVSLNTTCAWTTVSVVWNLSSAKLQSNVVW
jgi:hypothetical protein